MSASFATDLQRICKKFDLLLTYKNTYLQKKQKSKHPRKQKELFFKMLTIYQLYCKDPEIKDFYIGSTKNYTDRIYGHKYRCYDESSEKYNYKVYQFIRANGGFENWDFKVLNEVDYYPELRASQEQAYIILMSPSLNDRNALKDSDYHKEYHEQNKEKKANYYVVNKEIILQNVKNNYIKNKFSILEYHKEYNLKNKEEVARKKKEYYNENKEEFNRKNKEYRDENKEEINRKRREKRALKKLQIKNIDA